MSETLENAKAALLCFLVPPLASEVMDYVGYNWIPREQFPHDLLNKIRVETRSLSITDEQLDQFFQQQAPAEAEYQTKHAT